MRALEILLAITDSLCFFYLLIPGLKEHIIGPALIVLVLFIAGYQKLAEGFRWQILPAYVLALLLCFGILTDHEHKVIETIIISLSALLLASFFIIPVIFPVFKFPKPSGKYQIGSLTYHWTDENRQEIFSADNKDKREIEVQIWYPTNHQIKSKHVAYVDNAAALSKGLTQALSSGGLLKLPSFFFDHFKYIKTNAVEKAPIADKGKTFPVLIYVTGLDGFRQANMFQTEHLVSNGYIVIGIDQPYTSASVKLSDGDIIYGLSKTKAQPLIDQSINPKENAPGLNNVSLPEGIIPYLAEDIRFVADQLELIDKSGENQILANRLDLNHIGIFGVSLGAMIASLACHKDKRLKACLMMDAAIPADVAGKGLNQPGMLLTRSADDMRLERERSGGWTEEDINETLSTMHRTFENSKYDCYYVDIKGMFHSNFTDAPYWFRFGSQIGLTGPINHKKGFGIINDYTLDFFDKYLKDKDINLLVKHSGKYPEVKIKINN